VNEKKKEKYKHAGCGVAPRVHEQKDVVCRFKKNETPVFVNERGPNAPVREKERLAGEKKKEKRKGEPGGKGAAHTWIREKRGPPTHACE
jgi:hypothetical protein